MQPLVTCIMPTANRRRFVARAIDRLFAQTYANTQLVIVEDGEDNCSDLTSTLYRSESETKRIKHLHLGPRRYSIGMKRNIACAFADGEIIAHLDDDDWYSRRRLEVQVEALRDAQLCGLDRMVFFSPNEDKAELYVSRRNPWLAGFSLVYDRSLWYAVGGFADVSNGEDTAFVDAAVRSGARVAKLTDESLQVAVLHGHNSVERVRDRFQWSSYPADRVKHWMERT